MDWVLLTKWLLIVVILILAVYDVLAFYGGGIPATLSSVIWETSRSHPIIPFMLGVLIGHVIWPRQ